MTSDWMFVDVQSCFNGALALEPAAALPEAGGGPRHFLCMLKSILVLMGLDLDHAEFGTEGRVRGKGRSVHQQELCCRLVLLLVSSALQLQASGVTASDCEVQIYNFTF